MFIEYKCIKIILSMFMMIIWVIKVIFDKYII